MNLNNSPTQNELATLVAACNDDQANHMLWVDRNGDVYISQIPIDQGPIGFEEATPSMQVRYEMFLCGNGYVGVEASIDDDHMSGLFRRLIREWPQYKDQPKCGYIG